MNRPTIFLDIDGVLNDHTFHSNGYCGIQLDKAERLNLLIRKFNTQIVLHSAWRYMIFEGNMTDRGFNDLLQSHGVDGWAPWGPRLVGHTRQDSGGDYFIDRRNQILEFVQAAGIKHYIVLDDLDLDLDPAVFVKTDANKGLTIEDVEEAIQKLEKQISA